MFIVADLVSLKENYNFPMFQLWSSFEYIIVSRIVTKMWSVTCLATYASLTADPGVADPGVASSIPARSHTFMEIDHEIIFTVILLPSPDSFKKGWC